MYKFFVGHRSQKSVKVNEVHFRDQNFAFHNNYNKAYKIKELENIRSPTHPLHFQIISNNV